MNNFKSLSQLGITTALVRRFARQNGLVAPDKDTEKLALMAWHRGAERVALDAWAKSFLVEIKKARKAVKK
jgi:hypothetical protein